jgi:hypothetical protein
MIDVPGAAKRPVHLDPYHRLNLPPDVIEPVRTIHPPIVTQPQHNSFKSQAWCAALRVEVGLGLGDHHDLAILWLCPVDPRVVDRDV